MTSVDELEEGQVVSDQRTFTVEEVQRFAELSGDEGYHHLVAGQDGDVMVHGLLTATLPTKIGGELDYVARTMTFDFPRPVYTGETITCEVRVENVSEESGKTDLEVSWTCRNESDEVVMEGESTGVLFG